MKERRKGEEERKKEEKRKRLALDNNGLVFILIFFLRVMTILWHDPGMNDLWDVLSLIVPVQIKYYKDL